MGRVRHHLRDLEARGPVCKEGTECAWFLLEVRGRRLHLAVREPLDFDGIQALPRREYHYELEEPEAERLLEALQAEYGGDPAAVLQREFEYGNPRTPLRDYLTERSFAFRYWEEWITV